MAALFSYIYIGIMDVRKILGKFSGVSYLHENNGKIHVNVRPQTLSCRGTAQSSSEFGALYFYMQGHLKALVRSARIENGDTLD
jgi:hypothetical protein